MSTSDGKPRRSAHPLALQQTRPVSAWTPSHSAWKTDTGCAPPGSVVWVHFYLLPPSPVLCSGRHSPRLGGAPFGGRLGLSIGQVLGQPLSLTREVQCLPCGRPGGHSWPPKASPHVQSLLRWGGGQAHGVPLLLVAPANPRMPLACFTFDLLARAHTHAASGGGVATEGDTCPCSLG